MSAPAFSDIAKPANDVSVLSDVGDLKELMRRDGIGYASSGLHWMGRPY